MKVETYEAISIDEQDGRVVNEEVSEEALALIESLDLGGQRALIQKRIVAGEEIQTRNPYRLITTEELAIFGALMPNREKIEDYDGGPVPLRVLQVAAHCKTADLFTKIEVWCPAPGRDDPVLIGYAARTKESWRGEQMFLLARWGEELQSLDELRVKARGIVAARMRSAIAKAETELSNFKGSLDAKIDAFLHGEPEETVYVSLTLGR